MAKVKPKKPASLQSYAMSCLKNPWIGAFTALTLASFWNGPGHCSGTLHVIMAALPYPIGLYYAHRLASSWIFSPNTLIQKLAQSIPIVAATATSFVGYGMSVFGSEWIMNQFNPHSAEEEATAHVHDDFHKLGCQLLCFGFTVACTTLPPLLLHKAIQYFSSSKKQGKQEPHELESIVVENKDGTIEEKSLYKKTQKKTQDSRAPAQAGLICMPEHVVKELLAQKQQEWDDYNEMAKQINRENKRDSFSIRVRKTRKYLDLDPEQKKAIKGYSAAAVTF